MVAQLWLARNQRKNRQLYIYQAQTFWHRQRVARNNPNLVGVHSFHFREEDGGGGNWWRGSGRPKSCQKVDWELVQTKFFGELVRLIDGNTIIGLINHHMELWGESNSVGFTSDKGLNWRFEVAISVARNTNSILANFLVASDGEWSPS